MKYQPRFKRSNPENREEKLIVELCKVLQETTMAHIRLNQSFTDQEIFITLRDGAIGYAGQTVEALTRLMADTSQIPIFLKECQDIFNSYINEALENFK